MDYTISSGDCLWNIAKNNYNLSSNAEITQMVNQIAEDNNIENPSLIFPGQNISLAETDSFVSSYSGEDEEDDETTRADEFDEWTNSYENYEKCLNDEDVDGFQMFDFDATSYSSDLKDFAQEYIDKYDEDGDGKLNESEFTAMSQVEWNDTSSVDSEESAELYGQLFSDLNIDSEDDTINAGEFASYLYMADLDLDNYNGYNAAECLDGNLDYTAYQGLSAIDSNSSAYTYLQEQKSAFYNTFYACDTNQDSTV